MYVEGDREETLRLYYSHFTIYPMADHQGVMTDFRTDWGVKGELYWKETGEGDIRLEMILGDQHYGAEGILSKAVFERQQEEIMALLQSCRLKGNFSMEITDGIILIFGLYQLVAGAVVYLDLKKGRAVPEEKRRWLKGVRPEMEHTYMGRSIAVGVALLIVFVFRLFLTSRYVWGSDIRSLSGAAGLFIFLGICYFWVDRPCREKQVKTWGRGSELILWLIAFSMILSVLWLKSVYRLLCLDPLNLYWIGLAGALLFLLTRKKKYCWIACAVSLAFFWGMLLTRMPSLSYPEALAFAEEQLGDAAVYRQEISSVYGASWKKDPFWGWRKPGYFLRFQVNGVDRDYLVDPFEEILYPLQEE